MNPFWNIDYSSIERHAIAMAKRTKKIVVPPREERMEQIGDPKPPKMGKVSPTKIDVPEVDDLLEKLKKVTKSQEFSLCNANCSCPPCLAGNCYSCHVEALRNEAPIVVRAAVKQWRGVVYG